jgi:hypothetical protein
MIFTEIAEREAVQVPTVSWITEGAEIGVMRSDNERPPTRLKQAMELLHQADNISDVFDDMDSPHFLKAVVAKGKGDMVEISDNIGIRVCVSINADSAGVFFDTAADI